ncbi:MAG: hypothetical protein KF736_01190 [Acidobacteria bacterium]|nr:hypothetical protein [Acidobacteriota bacterium]MCW5948091.1 hypothetical protein [Pyrinomonadaceae bacterium]
MAKRNMQSGCGREVLPEPGRQLFDRDWEVLVIERDPVSGKYRTRTLCCESSPLIKKPALPCCWI